MATALNIRLNDELEEQLKKVVEECEEKDITVTQVVRHAICDYIEAQEESKKGLQTVKLPIEQLGVNELDKIYNSFSEIHQALLDGYSKADYVDEFEEKDLGENIEKCISDISKLLININKVKKGKRTLEVRTIQDYEYPDLNASIPSLIEQRNNYLDEMENILEGTKKEKRMLTHDENVNFYKLTGFIELIDKKKEQLDIEHNKSIYGKNNMTKENDTTVRMLDEVVLPNEKLEKRSYPNEERNLDLGELVKVMAGKGNNNSREDKYYRSMSTSGNKVVIPMELSDKIIDVARSQSAIFGNIPVVQMPHNNMKIAVQTGDAQANFVNENDLIPSSETIFAPVDLEGKTLAIFVPISEKLLDSASNLSQQLVYSCSQAISVALDKATLYGKGVSIEDGTHEIKGIFNYDTINQISHTGAVDYDAIIKGLKSVKQNNIIPSDICYSSTVSSELTMLKDTTGQYIREPEVLKNYKRSESNNIKDTDLLVYDKNSLLLGIHKGITIEWGYSSDMFQRLQKGLRIYVRADLGVVRPKGISVVNITE